MDTTTKTLNNTPVLFIKPLVTIILLLVGHYIALAQAPSASDLLALNDSNTTATADTWSFLSNSKKMYYLDFDELNTQLKEVQVKDLSGTVIFSDDVSDLPKVTLYELDLNDQAGGEYFLEVRTKNKVLRKLIHLK